MAYSGGPITSTSLVEAGFSVLRRNPALYLAYGGMCAVLQALQKMENTAHLGGLTSTLAVMLAVISVQIVVAGFVVRMALSREGLVADDVPLRMGTFIAVYLLFLIALFGGLVLLVVPGVLVMLRWPLATTFVLARGFGVRASLEASRDATAGHRGAVFGALMLIGLIAFIPIGIIMLLAGGTGAVQVLAWYSVLGLVTVVVNTIVGAIQTAFMVGVFAILAGHGTHYEEVFG